MSKNKKYSNIYENHLEIIDDIFEFGTIKHRSYPVWHQHTSITEKLGKIRIWSLLRHLIKFLINHRSVDKESSYNHLYHVITNCMIILRSMEE